MGGLISSVSPFSYGVVEGVEVAMLSHPRAFSPQSGFSLLGLPSLTPHMWCRTSFGVQQGGR